MKLKLMLWWLGVMLKRTRARKPEFREALTRLKRFDWGVATEDRAIARHYRMTPERVDSQSGLPVDLNLELRFRDADSATQFLRKPSQRAFREGLFDGRLRLVGDSRDLERLQSLLKFL
ncbi:hypothetical protein EVC62_06965 [Salinicola endophyticus]|uniref:SCP2 domain-containing protein n=1 Tax=Salinicola endophyticus TaxID=1949083 RepID=A0ABY8FFC6_9GAMM|nr:MULTISPECIES: hypothetical protein [Salinicola]WFF41262.1 hypothetical protein EVC62_06965 [Salinicola endophyticus]